MTAPTATLEPVKVQPTRIKQQFSNTRTVILGITGVVLFIAFLELAPRIGLVDPIFVPPFSEIVAAFINQLQNPVFWPNLGATVSGWITGLAIATVLGILLGVLIGSVPFIEEFTRSTIEFMRPIPSVAFIPVVVLLLGITSEATLVLVVYASFWPMLIQVIYGVQDVDPVARETSRSYRFRLQTRITKLVWPTALPYVLTGFRLSAITALLLEISGELIIGSPGIGLQIALAQQASNSRTMFALIFLAALLGLLVNLGTRALERRVLHWHISVRTDVQ